MENNEVQRRIFWSKMGVFLLALKRRSTSQGLRVRWIKAGASARWEVELPPPLLHELPRPVDFPDEWKKVRAILDFPDCVKSDNFLLEQLALAVKRNAR
jgi:hypothetical protein